MFKSFESTGYGKTIKTSMTVLFFLSKGSWWSVCEVHDEVLLLNNNKLVHSITLTQFSI